MELEILDKRENPLLDRVEVDFVISHGNKATPKRNAIRDLISKDLKVEKDRVIVDKMNTEFGISKTKGYAKVYSKKEAATQIEREHLLKRNNLIGEPKKEKPKEEKPAEKAPEVKDAPAEETKEE